MKSDLTNLGHEFEPSDPAESANLEVMGKRVPDILSI
jgi:hypothetical protein